MATQVQFRRGNTSATGAFTGAIAEITVDTDKKTVVVHDGSTAGGIPLAKEANLTAIFVQANASFDKANSANVLAQQAFDKANSGFDVAGLAYDKANGASFVANTDFTNISTSAGFYGNASIIPVVTLAANGRVSSITNTAVAITSSQVSGLATSATTDTTNASNIVSGTLDSARLPTSGISASGYGDNVNIPVLIVDTYGRLTSVTNTTIRSGTTSQTGIVQLQDSVTSTSTSNAATPNSVKTAYDLATGKFSSTGGTISGDVTVSGNLTVIGEQVYANTQTVLIKDNIITLNAAIDQSAAPSVNAGIEVDRGSSANVYLLWNETSDTWQYTNDGSTYLNIADGGRLDAAFSLANGTAGVANTDVTNISITTGTYGNSTHYPVITLSANGRVNTVTTVVVQDPSALAFAIALG